MSLLVALLGLSRRGSIGRGGSDSLAGFAGLGLVVMEDGSVCARATEGKCVKDGAKKKMMCEV